MLPIQPPGGLRPVPLRGHAAAWSGLVAVWAIVAALLWMLLGPEENLTGGDVRTLRIIAGAFLALFGPLALLVTWALLTAGNRTPRWRVDHEGVALWSRAGHAEVPWADVLAIGVSSKRPPAISSSVRLPQGHAVEVFVRSPDLRAAYPTAAHLVVDDGLEDPAADGLSSHRLRMVLSGGDVTDELGPQVAAHHPETWLGDYQRRWNPVPGG